MLRRWPFVLAILLVGPPLLLACDGAGGDGSDDGDSLDPACFDDWGDKSGGQASIMEGGWGEPCTSDADCVALINEDAFCVLDVLGVYALPNGYCSVPCSLPDNTTQYVPDSPQCSPDPGVDCVGAKGFFEACAIPCTDDSQCSREGYACTIFPQIGEEGDPRYCLMNAAVCCLDPDQCE